MPEPLSQKQQEEKLQFLKRDEVGTMAKDIHRLREEQSKQEFERIANVSRESAVLEIPKKQPEQLGQVIRQESPQRPLPKPLSRGSKLFIRFILVLAISTLLFLLALAVF